MAAIEPVEPELVHIGNESPSRQHRLVSEHSPPCVAQIIETLLNRRAVIALALLRRIEGALDVLELAEHLRDWLRAILGKKPHREIGFPDPPFAPAPGMESFG